MLSRAVWTIVLSLLAWIPVGRASAWAARGRLGDRAVLAVSVLEIAAGSPARIGSSAHVGIHLTAQKRPEPARTFVPLEKAPSMGLLARVVVGRAFVPREGLAWRPLRAKRLSFPHDAIAPPSSQS